MHRQFYQKLVNRQKGINQSTKKKALIWGSITVLVGLIGYTQLDKALIKYHSSTLKKHFPG